ncbi:MAG: hypothetical protein ACQEXJ_24105 [Myxococcota bacterium]
MSERDEPRPSNVIDLVNRMSDEASQRVAAATAARELLDVQQHLLILAAQIVEASGTRLPPRPDEATLRRAAHPEADALLDLRRQAIDTMRLLMPDVH